jgi:release factor glutamine methyltransferase
LDAEVLLAAALDCQRIELYTDFDRLASPEKRQACRELVRRRAEGTPVGYLVGYREFYSLPFLVSPAVLIPRPETEFLVIRLLDLAKQFFSEQTTIQIADVGTGSGILAVCAARHLTNARITAVDISPPALEVAQRNAQRHGVANRIEFVIGDLLENVAAARQFDFVVSNPPYVSRAEWHELPREVRDQEPEIALLGGEAGYEIIARLIPQAAARLRGAGWLLTEISPMIEADVHRLLQEAAEFDQVASVKDLAQLPRVVQARRIAGLHGPFQPSRNEIAD